MTNPQSVDEGKVDVLAVMDSFVAQAEGMAFRLDTNQPVHAWATSVKEARAAVAELIEACWYISAHAKPDEWMRFHEALARIGSTP